MTSGSFETSTLKAGISLERDICIGEDRTISFLGDELRVYETPSMIADIEYACRDLLFDNLADGWDSVGTLVNIEHLAATPVNEIVKILVSIEKISNRRVQFNCEVHDSQEIVGRGIHERFIIDVDRHRERIKEKKAKM